MKLDTNTLVAIGLVLCLSEASTRAGIQLTTLASFDGTNAANPLVLIPTGDGSMVGTARYGGIGFNGSSGGNGGVFKLAANGVLSNLVTFSGNPGNPGYMLRAADLNYYGTLLSGDGALFKLTADGTLTNFNPVTFGGTNGALPTWLVNDRAGSLYGLTFSGDATVGSYGTIFKVDPDGVFNTLAGFFGTNGAYPSLLVLGADGNFFGITSSGGTHDRGTVFRMTADGTLSTLFSCQETNGSGPSWLLQGSDGFLYGSAGQGGLGYGSLFKLTTNGTILWTFRFTGTNGSAPAFLMQGADGHLYGTTSWGGFDFSGSRFSGDGTVFRITPEGSFTSLLSLKGTNGASPFFMTAGADGDFYGTTESGGVHGFGTIFRLSIPMAPAFRSIVRTNSLLKLSWNAVAGQTYQVQYGNFLLPTNWSDLGSSIVATNSVMSLSDSISPDLQRFYRVVLLP